MLTFFPFSDDDSAPTTNSTLIRQNKIKGKHELSKTTKEETHQKKINEKKLSPNLFSSLPPR